MALSAFACTVSCYPIPPPKKISLNTLSCRSETELTKQNSSVSTQSLHFQSSATHTQTRHDT